MHIGKATFSLILLLFLWSGVLADPIDAKPSPSATKEKKAEPISWGRTEQLVPLGESRELTVKLPKDVTLSVTSSNTDVVTVTDLGKGKFRLTGVSLGSAVLTATASAGQSVPNLPVQVLPWAARWGNGPGQLEFAGTVDTKRVQTALERWLSARALPGAAISTTAAKDTPTDNVWQFQAVARAPGTIAVDTTVKIEVKSTPARAMSKADVVMLSNHPERIVGEGVLFQKKAVASSYRVMWHHRNDPEGPERFVSVSLTNPNASPRRLRMIWSSFGPSPDEIHVGHTAALVYATAGVNGHSEVITLPANGTRVMEFRRAKTGQTISGLAYLCDESGAELPLEVTVASTLPFVSTPSDQVKSRDPGRTASGVFPAEIELDASHTLGGPFTFIDYGNEPYVQDVDAGHPSYGNFSTMYRTRLTLHNPADSSRQAYIGFSAPGGAARGVLLFDGTLYDLPMGRSGDGVPVTTLTLEPGETRQVDVELFPQAGSNYPVRLVVRSDFERREKQTIAPSQPHRSLIP